jgi:excinuclease ABC subunit C
VIALAEDPLEAAVQVFYVRGGRVRGQRGWVVDKVEDLTTGDLVEHFIQQVYGGSATEPGDAGWGDSVPREVLVPAMPPDAEAVQQWLTYLRGATSTSGCRSAGTSGR